MLKRTASFRTFNIIGSIIIVVLALFCLLPFLLVISGSLTDNDTVLREGYSLIPKQFSTGAYKAIFTYPKNVLTAYGVTVTVTVAGTLLGSAIIAMAGYVLQRKDLKSRNTLSFLIYFTSIFQGGLIPWYIMITKYLRLSDSLWALILPALMNPFLIMLMRNYMKQSVPYELIEASKIDGAGDFRIFYSVMVPLCGPGIATVALFLGLAYWNDWYLTMLYISTPQKYSLQFYLYSMLTSAKALQDLALSGTGLSATVKVPGETTKLAMAMVATGPIIFLYPFIQRYFVKGLTIGAVKG